MTDADCIVIGAGPAGLGVAALATRSGMDVTVLERGSAPAARWATRYERLRINTSALMSHLPGRRFPLSYGRWPSRDQLLDYYRAYAAEHRLAIRYGTTAGRIDRERDGWTVETDGGVLTASTVVIATGKDNVPRIPDWRGRATFSGELSHSAEYLNGKRFAGRRVLVVGCGSSALDICLDLLDTGAAQVGLSVRTPPHLVRRAVAGVVPTDVVAVALRWLPLSVIDALAATVRRLTFGDLTRHGLPYPQDTFSARVLRKGMIPTIDPGAFVPAVRTGDIEVVPAVRDLTRDGTLLADGRRIAVDAVIACTGYHRGLEPLVGHLGVLDDDGHPVAGRGRAPDDAPGLYFIGYTDELTGNLRQIRLDAKRVARNVVETARAQRARPRARPARAMAA